MKLLLSFIILILSYYPVHADSLSREESKNILLKGEVLGHENVGSYGDFYLYLRDKENLYVCWVSIDTKANDDGDLKGYYDHIIQCYDWNGDMRDQY